MGQRQAVTKAIAARYRRASRVDKGTVLDELCQVTGWHRNHARKALGQVLVPRVVRERRPRAPTYGPDVVVALQFCWAVLGAPTGKRLAPVIGELVATLRRFGELDVSDEVAAAVVAMSPATMDRRLAHARAAMTLRGRSHTKPGSLLKDSIPIRTWAQCDDAVPGSVEIDLVGDDGGNAAGEHAYTLTVTDIATGWTENRSVPNKARTLVAAALEDISKVLPFPLLGIDSDNGSEFVNHHLLISKVRTGAKVAEKHDRATTPHQRASASDDVRNRPKITMNARMKRIKPAALSRQILALTGRLETLTQAKKAPRPNPSTTPSTRPSTGPRDVRRRSRPPGAIDMRQPMCTRTRNRVRGPCRGCRLGRKASTTHKEPERESHT